MVAPTTASYLVNTMTTAARNIGGLVTLNFLKNLRFWREPAMAPHHRFGKVDHRALRDAVEERLGDRTLPTLFLRVGWDARQDASADAFFDELAQRQGYWKTAQHSGAELFEWWCGLRITDAASEKSRIGDGLSDRTQAEMREERQAATDAVDALVKELQKAGMDLFCDATTIHVSKTPVGDPTNSRGDEESKSLCKAAGVLVFEGKQWRKDDTKGGRVFHRSHWLKLPCASGKNFFVREFEDLSISRLCQHAEIFGEKKKGESLGKNATNGP
jgi:hypothetical protein